MCVSVNLLMAFALGGCATVGDLGRPRHSIFLDQMNANMDKFAHLVSPTNSHFVYSREEEDIRKASVHFHEPLPSDLVPFRVVRMIRDGQRGASLASYGESLTQRGFRDGNARAGEIDEMLAADHLWLDRLSQAGRRVRAMDRERLFALEDKAAPFSPNDRIATHARIEENADILSSALSDLDERLAGYHYAMQRTRIEWPGTSLSRTQSSLKSLRAKAGRLRSIFGLDGSGIEYEEVEVIAPVAGYSNGSSKYRAEPRKPKAAQKPKSATGAKK